MNKKIFILVSASALLLALAGVAAYAYISASQGNLPVITNAFTDKSKYFPGEQMTITAETENALSVKAFVENEKGYNEVNLVMIAKNGNKQTWTGKWKVEDSFSGKKYKLKISASSKAGIAEKMLEWEDPAPNPGHTWGQIGDFPADCPAGQYVSAIDTGACSTPASGGIPASAIWAEVSSDQSPRGCAVAGVWENTPCVYTVGSDGGNVGRFGGNGGSGLCFVGAPTRLLVNGAVVSTGGGRVNIPVAANASLMVQMRCNLSACWSSDPTSCELGLWDY